MKELKIIGWVFFSIGLILLISSLITFENTKSFIHESNVVEGEVIDLVLDKSTSGSTHGVYHPVIKFSATNGEYIEFRGSVGSRPPKYEKGEIVNVRYHPENPYRARIDGFFSVWLAPLILIPLGVCFTTIGFVLLYVLFKSDRRKKFVEQCGKTILSDSYKIEVDKSTTINGLHPWVVVAQWHDKGRNQIYTFKSPAYKYDPTSYMKRERICIKIDPDNPKAYKMDLSFLPES